MRRALSSARASPRPARRPAFVRLFAGVALAALTPLVGCGAKAKPAESVRTTPPGTALTPVPASPAPAVSGAPTASAALAAAPPPDLAWLSDRGAGPLCAAQAQGARRRLEAIGRAFGVAYFNERFEQRDVRNEAFFCREDATLAWSVSVAGLDDENAAPCSPAGDEACAQRAALATRVAVRAVEAG
jgi:hypothetical protein